MTAYIDAEGLVVKARASCFERSDRILAKARSASAFLFFLRQACETNV